MSVHGFKVTYVGFVSAEHNLSGEMKPFHLQHVYIISHQTIWEENMINFKDFDHMAVFFL